MALNWASKCVNHVSGRVIQHLTLIDFTYSSGKRMSLDPIHQIAAVARPSNDGVVDINSRDTPEVVHTADKIIVRPAAPVIVNSCDSESSTHVSGS